MAIRYFTVEEANELLPQIEPLVGDLLDRRARVVYQRQAIGSLLDDLRVDIGGTAVSELTVAFEEIERLVRVIQSHGCVIKSINVGLIDFWSKIDGDDVFLCWRYGEDRIEHYHPIHEGFNGRLRL